MKLKLAGVAVALLSVSIIGASGCQPEFQPGAFIDDAGREVVIDEAPERIVSHVPPITETIFALGLGDRVVGVSDYCDYPEEATLKPSVGNYFNPSVENIVALDPDLVLTDGHSDTIKQLDSLGINFLVIDPKDFDDIFDAIELLGKATGVQNEASRLTADMQKVMDRVRSRVGNANKVRTLYVIDATDLNNPWTAGPGSLIDSLITMAGGENVAHEAQDAWVQLSIEKIVSADPEVIILPGEHGTAFTPPEVLEGHPAWRELTAVRQGKVFIIEGDLVDGYGPRIVQGLEEMAKLLHPGLFD